MEDIPKPIEVGFAEFIAKLVSEVFDAIVTSQFDQEKRIADLSTVAGLPSEEFAKKFVTDEQTIEELERLFPGDSKKHPTTIYEGAPYRIASGNVSEFPPINAILGITLQKGDYRLVKKKAFLTSSGVNKVKFAVRQHLAKAHQAAVNEIIRRGLPRVIADAGRVNAKLTYEVLSLQGNQKPEKDAKLGAPLRPLGHAVFIPESGALSKLRLVVRQADERLPQNQKLKVNVFGEVEVEFKTLA
jgi:hypothetical protein